MFGKRVVLTLQECFLVSGWCLCSESGWYSLYRNAFLFQGGVCVRKAGGTHSTGMLSCFRVVFVFGKQVVHTLQECFLVSGWCLCLVSRWYSLYRNVFLFQGGVCVWEAGGTHSTGMLSCFRVVFVFGKQVCSVSGWCAPYRNAFLFQGGVCVRKAGGMHPTGMISCFRVVFVFRKLVVHTLQECFLVSGWCLCLGGGWYAPYRNAFLFQGGVCVR